MTAFAAHYGLDEMRGYVPQAAKRVEGVSGWSVGMHLHHVNLAMIGVFRSLAASEPPVPQSAFNPVRAMVFTSGRIPRGRAKSPEAAVPSDGIGDAELVAMLDESERLLEASRTLSPDHWYRHFAFGVLDRDRTLKFIRIHNRHHLRIVRDILRA